METQSDELKYLTFKGLMEHIHERYGISISRSTIRSWIVKGVIPGTDRMFGLKTLAWSGERSKIVIQKVIEIMEKEKRWLCR